MKNYEDQFYIAERTIYFPAYRGKPFVGFKGKHYFSGTASFRREVIESNHPTLSVLDDVRYFVLDDYACPVGEIYSKGYSFLNKHGITFPNCSRNKNGFVFYDEAEEFLEKIKIYFEKARKSAKRKTDQRSIQQIFHAPCPTTRAIKEMNSNSGLEKRAKRKSDLSPFIRECYEDPVV